MLIRGVRRHVPFLVVGPLLILTFFFLRFYNNGTVSLPWPTPNRDEITPLIPQETKEQEADLPHDQEPLPSAAIDANTNVNTNIIQNDLDREVFSVSTFDKKYFSIDFDGLEALNPNIIPHPSLENVWIIVAQQKESNIEHTVWHVELVCNATFKNGTLSCDGHPMVLPIAATPGDNCRNLEGSQGTLALSIGPHDARVFYGPQNPYTIYGSNSELTCFGMWMLDFRLLVDWGLEDYKKDEFRAATELRRPGPYLPLEKNWFIFWDKDDLMYVHHDTLPKRGFAKLEYDGSVGQDLAPLAAASDGKCQSKYMPKISNPELESIHQATNSLSITLCKRLDTSCEVKDSNTFIFTIFQHKSFYFYHSDYRPYVMLFQRTAPFAIHGIATKPIWIHGRGRANEGTEDHTVTKRFQATRQKNQNEMFYITSMSWKTQGQKYHGYIDDVLFLAFGIEDMKTGGIDIAAGDLLLDMGICSEL